MFLCVFVFIFELKCVCVCDATFGKSERVYYVCERDRERQREIK